MKIVVFIVSAFVQLAGAAVGFFILLIALNGYGEKQAGAGLIFYIILSIMSAASVGAASAHAAQKLAARTSLGDFGASTIAVLSFAVLGLGVLIIGFFGTVFVVEVFRK